MHRTLTWQELFFSGRPRLLLFSVATLAILLQLFTPEPSQAARSAGFIRYTIDYGDSLTGIAKRNRISPDSIQFPNSSRRRYPLPGTIVILPVESPPKSPSSKPLDTLCSHRVVYGESIFAIARRYGVDPYYLARINWLYDADYIYAGQVLRVPCRPSPPSSKGCANAVWYQVKPGDNLFRIAIRYGTTVYAIAIANRIPNPNFIRSGTNLYIPCQGTTTYPNVPPTAAASPTTLVLTAPSPAPTTPVPTPTRVVVPTATPIVTVPTQAPVVSGTASPTVNPLLAATAVPRGQTITMQNAQFQPSSLQVKVGTTVIWVNAETSDTPHLVISGTCVNEICTPTNQFASDVLPRGASFPLRFTFVGTYPYYCALHGALMTGTITVVP